MGRKHNVHVNVLSLLSLSSCNAHVCSLETCCCLPFVIRASAHRRTSTCPHRIITHIHWHTSTCLSHIITHIHWHTLTCLSHIITHIHWHTSTCLSHIITHIHWRTSTCLSHIISPGTRGSSARSTTTTSSRLSTQPCALGRLSTLWARLVSVLRAPVRLAVPCRANVWLCNVRLFVHTRVCGCVVVWLCGCVVVWLCGCVVV